MDLNARLLLVDNSRDYLDDLLDFTSKNLNLKLENNLAQSLDEALSLIGELNAEFAVIIINQVLADTKVIEQIHIQDPVIRIIYLCSDNPEGGIKALQAGAYRFFVKPVILPELGYCIKQAVVDWQTLSKVSKQRNSVNVPNPEFSTTVESRLRLTWLNMVGSTWGHSIKMNAITIRERVQLCRRLLEDQSVLKKFEENLQVIEDLTTQMLEKPFPAPLGAEESSRVIPLNDFLRARIRQMWNSEPYTFCQYHLDLKLADTQLIRVSPEWLRKLLELLLQNAVKAVSKLNYPLIIIASQETNDYAEIIISDKGQGISNNILPNLFVRPITKTSEESGQGLGLLLAKTIVEAYHGFLRIESTGSMGTTLIISLPLVK